jgi:hypothetical protein
MHDLETIDSELRLLAAVRRSIREHGGEPSSRQVDELSSGRRPPASRRPQTLQSRTGEAIRILEPVACTYDLATSQV